MKAWLLFCDGKLLWHALSSATCRKVEIVFFYNVFFPTQTNLFIWFKYESLMWFKWSAFQSIVHISGLAFGVENLRGDTKSCCALWRMILTNIGGPDNWLFCAWHRVSQACPHYRPHIRWFHWDQKGNVMLSNPECHVMLYLPRLVTTVAVQRLWWCL